MAEMVGAATLALRPWARSAVAAAEAPVVSVDRAAGAGSDAGLVWQSAIGQVFFLESVARDPG